MSEELVAALVTGVFSLLVAFAVYQLQQGGRLRRLRREIVEELDLIDKLGDRPEIRARLRRRVDRRLEEYAPGPRTGARPSIPDVSVWIFAVSVAVCAVPTIALAIVLDLDSAFAFALVGVAPALLAGSFLADAIEGRRRRRDDEAATQELPTGDNQRSG